MSPIMVSDNNNWKPAPEGVHQAVCCDVVELGMVDTDYGPKNKIKIVWQIDAIDPDSSHRFTIQNRYTTSLNEKARLCKDLEMWRGKAFTGDEKKGFDVERLIGANCQIQVVHNTTEKGTYANVKGILPLMRGTELMHVMGYVREKDREDDDDAPPLTDDDIQDADIPF